MNARSAVFVLLAGALCVSLLPSMSAAPDKAVPMAYTVTAVRDRHYEPVVERGTTALSVLSRLGVPQRKLDGDVWVYFAFHGNLPEAGRNGCTTLLITFANNRVSDMKLVNQSACTVVAARLKTNPAERQAIYVAHKQIAVGR